MQKIGINHKTSRLVSLSQKAGLLFLVFTVAFSPDRWRCSGQHQRTLRPRQPYLRC